MHRIRTATTATLVRAQVATANAGDRLAEGAQHRLDRLREVPESGAQTAEYAMLGGVGAAMCGGLIFFLKDSDVLGSLLKAVFRTLTKTVGTWFS